MGRSAVPFIASGSHGLRRALTTWNDQKITRLYKAGTLGLAIKGEIGNVVSILGSVVGSERLVYNPWTYAIFYRAALEISPTMVEGIMTLFPTHQECVGFRMRNGRLRS